MRTIKRLTVLAGLSLVLLTLAAIGARAQAIESPSFTGTFTLPAETHWGAMTLPAGDYTLRYGTAFSSTYLVTVANKAEARILGMILPNGRDGIKAAENGLDCVREGNMLYVRALEMPLIGEAIHFKIPHGVEVRSKVIAKNHSPSGKTQLTQVAIRIEPAPVK